MSTKKKPPLPHPTAKAIEDVFTAGHTPRIHVDSRRSDVTVPDHVRERWQARLVIDLDPSWPLRLEYLPEGVGVDLAFSGLVNRCVFGWDAIYVVLDRATGRGNVIEAHLPPHELPEALAHIMEAPRAVRTLKVVPSEGELDGPAPRAEPAAKAAPAPKPEKAEKPEKAAPKKRTRHTGGQAEATVSEAEPTSESNESEAPSSSDERAKERRARFRVIDGGS